MLKARLCGGTKFRVVITSAAYMADEKLCRYKTSICFYWSLYVDFQLDMN